MFIRYGCPGSLIACEKQLTGNDAYEAWSEVQTKDGWATRFKVNLEEKTTFIAKLFGDIGLWF
jgi:hypothetical protein